MNYFPLSIARGLVPGHIAVHKFGFNAAVSSTKETIWSYGGMINWPASASVMKVSSSSTADTSPSGTGARTISVYGLDSNWDLAEESVTLTGRTQATTTTSFVRVFRVICNTFGSGGTNAGTIFVYTGTATDGTPDSATAIYATVGIGDGQTLQAAYTVPRNYIAYLVGLDVSSYGTANVSIEGRLEARADADLSTSGFVTKDVYLSGRTPVPVDFKAFPLFAGKTDLQVTGKSSGVDGDMSASFDLILVQQ